MGNEIHDEDAIYDDEEYRNDEPPREITPEVVDEILKLDSVGKLEDLQQDLDENIRVVHLRKSAKAKAERLENLKNDGGSSCHR